MTARVGPLDLYPDLVPVEKAPDTPPAPVLPIAAGIASLDLRPAAMISAGEAAAPEETGAIQVSEDETNVCW